MYTYFKDAGANHPSRGVDNETLSARAYASMIQQAPTHVSFCNIYFKRQRMQTPRLIGCHSFFVPDLPAT